MQQSWLARKGERRPRAGTPHPAARAARGGVLVGGVLTEPLRARGWGAVPVSLCMMAA